MEVTHAVTTTGPSGIREMMGEDPDAPVFMVNLLKFRDRTEYADGRKTGLSGRETHHLHARTIVGILLRFGGTFLAHGTGGRVMG